MYINDPRGLAIIPAKTDSTRLKKKNLRVIAGKTLVEHALDYATNSELIKHIIVTTESDEVKELTKKYKNIEILWASTREAYNYTQAKQINCNIITMPPKVINQISNFGKSFKSMTLDTVKSFLADSKKSRFSL